MDRGEPLITGSNRAPSALLQIHEKDPDDFSRYIANAELIDWLLANPRRERQQQTESIAIALLRVVCEITLCNDVLQKKPPNPWTK
jgi:hypothetical protein